MIESRSMNQCGRRDLNPHTHWVSDFKSEASADSAIAAHKGIIAHFPAQHKPVIPHFSVLAADQLQLSVPPFDVTAMPRTEQ